MLALVSKSAKLPLQRMTLASRPLAPDEIRVRVRSVGVNPVDWKMRAGGPLRFAHRFVGPSGPLVVGVDFSGEVSELGSAVSGIAIGARVVGGTDFSRKQFGSYADEVVVKLDQIAELPDNVSFDEAACLPVPGATALQALVDFAHINLKKDARVLVLGASGGVGLCAIQLAKMYGAHVVGVSSTRNVALVEGLGATGIDYTQGDALEAARAQGPYDLVFHAVGTKTYPLGKCRSMLSKDGVVALVVIRAADLFALWFSKQVRSSLGRPRRPVLEVLVNAVASGALTSTIEATFGFDDAEAAHAKSRQGKVVGKLLLHPGADPSQAP